MVSLLAATLTGLFAVLLAAALTGNLPRMHRWASRRPRAQARRTWLAQAGVDLTPAQFVAGSAVAGAVSFLLVTAATGAPAVALVPAVAVALLPRAYFSRRRATRLKEVERSWPDGLRELNAAIAAGLSLHQALVGVSNSGPEPLRAAFARYPLLADVLGVVPALEVMKEGLADPTSDRVLEILVLAHERGGHLLPDLLRDLAEATAKDALAQEQITTEALEQKINARAVLFLPWVVLLVLTIRPGHFRDFYQSSSGVLVVIAGALLSLVGIAIVSRLARDPDEPRVFGSAASGQAG